MLHNLVEASFDLFRYLLLGDQLKPWELLSTGIVYELLESQFVVMLSDQPRSDSEDIAKHAFLHSYTKAATSAGFCTINTSKDLDPGPFLNKLG